MSCFVERSAFGRREFVPEYPHVQKWDGIGAFLDITLNMGELSLQPFFILVVSVLSWAFSLGLLCGFKN